MRQNFSPTRALPSAAQYARWRKTLPWTDEEFACAMDEAANESNDFLAQVYRRRAASIRAGRLSGKDVSIVLGRLIIKCSLCGKKALYRTGIEGRCSAHRLVKAGWENARVARLERRSCVITNKVDVRDKYDKHIGSLKKSNVKRNRYTG